jgi:hypothetical protein
MLWVKAVSKAPVGLRRLLMPARLHREEEGEIEMTLDLALGLGDEAGDLRLFALVLRHEPGRFGVALARLRQGRRGGGPPTLAVGAALVDERERARCQRGDEQRGRNCEGPGQPAPGP